VAGGVLYEYGNEYIIRGMLDPNRVEAISRAVVKSNGDFSVTLADIAEVRIGNKAPKTGVASHNTRPAVMLTVTKQPHTGTLDLSERLDAVLADLQAELPHDVKMATDIYRQERFINSSVDNVKQSLLEGGLFVIIVLFLFLANVRTTVISLVMIPLSLLVSVLSLHFMGLTINTMSLGGMAIAIGSLVDDAIVDVENVFRRLRENSQLPPAERRSRMTVIYDASREVRMPILNSTLIIIAGFVPLFFLSGMEGRMLVPLGIAFITSLVASTIVALTLTPVLCSYLLARQKEGGEQKEPFVSRKLRQLYVKALAAVMRRPRIVLAGTGVLTLAALIGFMGLGRSFLPPFNEGSFTINISTLPGISLEESDKLGARAERLLLDIPEIQTVGRKTGRAELDEHALGVNVSEIEAPYVLDGRSKEAVMKDIRERLQLLPGISVEVGSPISHRIDAMLSGTQANIAIKLFGTDLNRMYAIGNEIKESIGGIEGLADLNVEQQVDRPQLRIEPRRGMMAKYGVTMPQFAEMVSVLLLGETVSQVYEGNKAFDLTLKVSDDSRHTAEQIRNMIVDAGGRKIPFGHIAEVRSDMGPNTINRENVARKIVISANVQGRDLRSVVNDIQANIAKNITLPDGYHIAYGGQFESEQAASRILLIASVFSVLVIFMLLFSQFRSVVLSLVILLNLPLALIGGVFAVWCTGGVLSIPSIIGFISLFGIATRNGMLLIARYNDLRAEGLPLLESIMQGSADRLNPIFMTALTSALALVPMVLGGDLPGNEIQSPMAKVILGGLFTSTFLNGFIIPIMYMLTSKKFITENATERSIEE
ncbi:MAG: efflux RND transporter permease subunit, partial [Bacteroidaceae bacterium]|nr:efflux RND transporter permease subunit [Bacteroidaceae bacterium]